MARVTPSIVSPFSKLEASVPATVVAATHEALMIRPVATAST